MTVKTAMMVSKQTRRIVLNTVLIFLYQERPRHSSNNWGELYSVIEE